MNPIEIKIPDGAQLVNFLYPEMDRDDFTQDLVTVALPNGYVIDVGWYPECDPNGRFVIRVFHGTWDNQRHAPIMTKSLTQVVSTVQTLAEYFNKAEVKLNQSTSEQHAVSF